MTRTEFAKVVIDNETGEIVKIEYDGNDGKCKDLQKILSDWLAKDGIFLDDISFSENPKDEVKIKSQKRISMG